MHGEYLEEFFLQFLDVFNIFESHYFRLMEEQLSRPEYTEEQLIVAKELEKKFENVLSMVGLQTPVDYIFLDFALQKSRLALSTVSDSLHFLFHTVSQHDLDNADRPFPFSIFVEKYKTKIFQESDAQTKEEEELVLWSLIPSKEWEKRPILPFTDFHLYFQDVLRPLYGYSAEDLYRLFDQKRGQLFFVTHGTRSSTESKRIVTLFVTMKNIIVFHFDAVDVTEVKKEDKFMSKWISLSLPISIKSLSEYAIFELPDRNLVMTHEEVKEAEKMDDSRSSPKTVTFSTPGLDTYDMDECVSCSS